MRNILCLCTCLFFFINVNVAQVEWLGGPDDIYWDAGNVGIGTSTPLGRFHIKDNNSSVDVADINDAQMIIDNFSSNCYMTIRSRSNKSSVLYLGNGQDSRATRFQTYHPKKLFQLTHNLGTESGLISGKKFAIDEFGHFIIGRYNHRDTDGIKSKLTIRGLTSQPNFGYLTTFESVADDGDSKIKLLGKKENIDAETSIIDFSNFDYNDQMLVNKQYTVARISSVKTANSGHEGSLRFFTNEGNSDSPTVDGILKPRMYINEKGQIGINTESFADDQHMLVVKGHAYATKVKVDASAGADFVFDEEYQNPSLEEVESFIKANKHLPEIPSEKEMLEEGLYLGEFQIKLLQKIEELTLHTIEQGKQIKELQKEILQLKTK